MKLESVSDFIITEVAEYPTTVMTVIEVVTIIPVDTIAEATIEVDIIIQTTVITTKIQVPMV